MISGALLYCYCIEYDNMSLAHSYHVVYAALRKSLVGNPLVTLIFRESVISLVISKPSESALNQKACL